MARPRKSSALAVVLNGRPVGRLERAADGAISFVYDRSWLDWPHAMPVSLSLPLRAEAHRGEKVLAYFENLLPDNATLRSRIAQRVGAGGTDAYNLLAAIGRDCVGALQFLPEPAPADAAPVGAVEGKRLSTAEIARRLRSLDAAPLGLSEEDDSFRISIAGAQEKTALLRYRGGWLEPRGTTPTTHILKPAIGVRRDGLDLSQSVENEHFCLRFLAGLGLPVARTEIADFDGERVLVVERFDRLWASDGRLLRLPQEDFCQALGVPPSRKYQADGGPGILDGLALLAGADDPLADQLRFVTAQIAYWLLGATDGHGKNFSVFLSPGGRYRTTPLYDVMSAQPNVDAGQMPRNKMKLAMKAGTTRGGHYPIFSLAPRHFRQTALAGGLPAARVDEVFARLAAAVPGALEQAREEMPRGFPTALEASIRKGVLSRAEEFAMPGP